MAVTLLFSTTKASIGTIELDASLSESHVGEVDVTEHPVEKGINISDHVRPLPEVVTIEGFITNTPLRNDEAAVSGRSTFPLTFSAGTLRNAQQLQPARAGKAYSALLEMKDKGQLITVVTGIRSYENMVIKSLTVPRDAKEGQAIRFTAILKQVKVVSSQRVAITVKETKHAGKVSQGKKAGKTAPQPTVNKSAAAGLLDTGVSLSGNQGGFSNAVRGLGFVP